MLIGALSLVIVVCDGHLDELLAQVDAHRPVDERDQEHEPGTLRRAASFVRPNRKTTSRAYC